MDTIAIKTAPPHAPLQQQQHHQHIKQQQLPTSSLSLSKSNINCSNSNFYGIGNTEFYPKSKNIGAFFQICKVK